MIKKEPKDVKEAIALRKAVLNISEVEKMDEFTYPIFEHYDTYIKNWAKNNDVSTLVDPKILEKKDLTGLDLEAIGLLRNEILGLGFIETDLNGKLLEVYNYYSDAIKNLIKTDRTLDVEIVQHDKRKTVNYKLSLNTNLDKEYEMQHPSSNDCWSCAGVGIFNHFIRNEKGYLNHKQTQADFRNIKMDYVPQEESNLDNETYLKRLTDIEDFTTNNHSTDRRHTPMGDPYVTADFYLDRLRKIPGYENSAVRKSVFNFIAADSYVKGVGGQGSAVKKDTNAVHNLTEYFKKTVADALAKDSAIAMLLGKHYVTITGIDGDMLKIRDSNNSTRTTMKLSDVTEVDAYSRPVELVWLEKIQDPAATAGTFSTLDYDKETGTFASNGRMREVGSYEEEIAHKQGVGAWRTVDDKDSDISVFVSEAIYVPKTFMGTKKNITDDEKKKELERQKEIERQKEKRDEEARKNKKELSEKRIQEAFEQTRKELEQSGQKVMKPHSEGHDKSTSVISALDDKFDAKMIGSAVKGRKNPIFGYKDNLLKTTYIKQKETNLDCYLLSTLAGIVNTHPEYMKDIISDSGDTSDTAVVKLYDANGIRQSIIVQKTRMENDSRDMWVQLIEKAATVIIGKNEGSAGFRYRIELNHKWDKESSQIKNHSLSYTDLQSGSEELACQLLFGRKGISLITRDDDVYDDKYDAKIENDSHKRGDEAIGKALAYAAAGKIVTASTCTNSSSFEKYNKINDAVKFPMDLHEKHVHLILGEGKTVNGERSLKIWEPIDGRELDIPFSVFKTCFTDVYISGVEGELIKKNTDDDPQ